MSALAPTRSRSRHRPRSRVGAPGRRCGAGKAQIPRRGGAVSGRRYYNPHTGKWLSRDRIQEKGGNNLYAFVLNNPTNAYDAHGDLPVLLVIAGAGAVGGIAGQAVSDIISGSDFNWRNYWVAGSTGALSAVAVTAFGPGSALAVSAINNGVTSTLQQAWTTGGVDPAKVGLSVAGAFAGKVVANNLKIQGLNAGKNSSNAVTQSTMTKAANSTILSASVTTGGRMAASLSADNFASGIFDGGLNGLYEFGSDGDGKSNGNSSGALMMATVTVSPKTSGTKIVDDEEEEDEDIE